MKKTYLVQYSNDRTYYFWVNETIILASGTPIFFGINVILYQFVLALLILYLASAYNKYFTLLYTRTISRIANRGSCTVEEGCVEWGGRGGGLLCCLP